MLFEHKKIIVTGGSGFIGKNLIPKLIEAKANVLNISLNEVKGIKNIRTDLTDTNFSFLDDLDVDYVVHLAAFSSPARSKNEEETFKLNVDATRKFFDKLSEKNVKKVIFMSTSVIYKESDEPLNEESDLDANTSDIYTRTKLEGGRMCEEFRKNGLPVIVFRLSNTYGPYQQWKESQTPTLIPTLISDAILHKKIVVWNKKPVRDYIYVEDVVDAIIKGLDSEFAGTLNLGTGVGSSVETVANTISQLTGAEIECLNKETKGPQKITLNISKIKEKLSWEPKISLIEGFKKCIKHYNEVFAKEK